MCSYKARGDVFQAARCPVFGVTREMERESERERVYYGVGAKVHFTKLIHNHVSFETRVGFTSEGVGGVE